MATTQLTDFKVADLSLADYGRKEIQLAEHEMPGLMATRREFADAQPLKGARITGSLHMTIQTAVFLETLQRSLAEDPQRWTRIAAGVKGVTEETTTGVHRLYQLAEQGQLLFPAINVNDSVTKSKFDNLYGCRHSLIDTADIFVTATGNKDIISAEHMARMKHNAIVGNIGHFDNEIDMAGLAKLSDVRKVEIKPQVHEFVFPDGHSIIVLAEGRLLNLGCATGHPSFVMSNSFSNQVIAQMELYSNAKRYE